METSDNAYQFTFHGIDGGLIKLSDYAGKAMLVVNTASACGFTPQYRELEALWKTRRDQGLIVLGVPSDDFNQERGNDSEIKQFCDLNYHVTFPMTAKTPVTGTGAHPFYQWIAAQVGFVGRPHWNFYKYVLNREGRLVSWFSCLTKPDSQALIKTIETALG